MNKRQKTRKRAHRTRKKRFVKWGGWGKEQSKVAGEKLGHRAQWRRGRERRGVHENQ